MHLTIMVPALVLGMLTQLCVATAQNIPNQRIAARREEMQGGAARLNRRLIDEMEAITNRLSRFPQSSDNNNMNDQQTADLKLKEKALLQDIDLAAPSPPLSSEGFEGHVKRDTDPFVDRFWEPDTHFGKRDDNAVQHGFDPLEANNQLKRREFERTLPVNGPQTGNTCIYNKDGDVECMHL